MRRMDAMRWLGLFGTGARSALAGVLAFACMIVLFAAPVSAAEKSPVYAAKCHAYSDVRATVADLARSGTRWRCNDEGWRSGEEVAWLRFDAETWVNDELPSHFFTRIARYQSIAIIALDRDGITRTARYGEADAEPYAKGPVFQLTLPDVTSATRAVFVRIEGPHSVPLQTEAALSPTSEGGEWTQLEVMLLAFVLGMLVLPLLLDASFYWVLRERFVLLHAVMIVAMIGYVLFASGLISVFAEIPMAIIAVLGPLSWAFGIGFSAIFLHAFLEPGSQSKWMRRLTLATGFWTIAVPSFFALQLRMTQPFDDQGYFYGFLPAIIVISIALIEALFRGSRSAKFVAIAWFPIIAASVERMLRGLGLYTAPSTLDQLLYVGTGLEVTIIAVAVGDRYLTLKRERDEAMSEARTLEKLTERDPLTGLMNRRAVDAHFDDLHRAGYETFAVYDLDHFKQVNDTAGHFAGDRVLQVVAEVLDAPEDAMAVRLGGEEFLVMLRGERAEAQAEELRQAIPLRVAQQVTELDRLVTASCGILVMPREAVPKAVFSDIYSRADQLLYEAKSQGRNRAVSERLQAFAPQSDRRRKRGRRKSDNARRDPRAA